MADHGPGGRDAPPIAGRIAVTLAVLLAYRLGLAIPLAGIDGDALATLTRGSWMAIERVSVFAIGLVPLLSVYTLAETLRLLAPGFAAWQAQARNDARLQRWLRMAALVLAAVQGWGIAVALEGVPHLVSVPGLQFRAGVIATLVAATALLSWLADVVTRRGLGNGFWLLVATPIVAMVARNAAATVVLLRQGALSNEVVLATLAYLALGTAALVGVDRARHAAISAMPRFSVWPPILAYTAMSWITAVLFASGGGRWPGAAQPLYFIALGLLIWFFCWRDAGAAEAWVPVRALPPDRTSDDERLAFLARRRVRVRLAAIVALVQIAICAAAEMLTPLSPSAIPGMWLIVVVAVALGILDKLRVPSPSATS